jgi:hypothetical protein
MKVWKSMVTIDPFSRRSSAVLLSILFCVTFPVVAFGADSAIKIKVCASTQAESADTMTDTLDSWRKVSLYFEKYRACDDGSIAEGSAEAIARLLVDKWQTLPELALQIQRDPALELFVISHLNGTLDTGDLKKIAQRSESSCPSGAGRLCENLNKAARQSLHAPG